ncbi:MAG: SGNH/GDSL hydrolase family protein [Acidobacteria bacterium]|nr:SGNH/GDSL hydrolase family protein [Acidobacteriota bacterium]
MLSRRHFTFLCGATAFAQAPAEKIEADWHDASKLTVEGLAFQDRKSPWDRLPARAEGVVRKEVWALSRDSAGALVRFTSNATQLRARWTLTRKSLAGVNMTAIGASGLDLYVKTGPASWRWLGVGRPSNAPEIESVLATGIPAGDREYMLYLPLYNGVKTLEIAVPKGATLTPAPARPPARKPIVFYGTSITQGASATRPGMCHPAILGRWLDRAVINLGFSGNGRMESEVIKFITEIDAAAFVLDCLPNITAKEVEERTEPGVKMLRAAHPNTPILLVEDRNYPQGFLLPTPRERNQSSQAALRAAFQRLQKAKIRSLYYLAAPQLLGDDGEATTDGSHPSDLGFVRQAKAFEKPLRKMLG